MCKTFEVAECHNNKLYAAIILLILAPVYCLKRLSNIGYFSIVALFFTLLAVILIIIICSLVISKSPEENEEDYNLHITEEDKDYTQLNWAMLPIFCATMNSLFEGNQQILNLYAETDRPQRFFKLAAFSIVGLTVFIAVVVSYLGYIAFGNTVKSVIIYNLPNGEPMSITVKICYVITICGSFVLLIQPVYHIIENTYFYKTGRCCEPSKDDGDENAAEDLAKGGAAMSQGDDMNEGGSQVLDDDEDWGCLLWTKFIIVRLLIAAIILFISILIPNINILLTISGAILGTICNVWLPVFFYTRAYNGSQKNLALQGTQAQIERRR